MASLCRWQANRTTLTWGLEGVWNDLRAGFAPWRVHGVTYACTRGTADENLHACGVQNTASRVPHAGLEEGDGRQGSAVANGAESRKIMSADDLISLNT